MGFNVIQLRYVDLSLLRKSNKPSACKVMEFIIFPSFMWKYFSVDFRKIDFAMEHNGVIYRQ